MTSICAHLQQIIGSIDQTVQQTGRQPGSVKLVAVTKTVPAILVKEAMNCGHMLFGENYLQEAQEKISQLGHGARWHFIGRLQSNKCRDVASLFDMVETVDRVKVAQRLNEQAESLGRRLNVLVQVNIGEETQKSGVMPEETKALLEVITTCSSLNCHGLMALPPYFDAPDKSRPYFRLLRQLSEQCAQKELFYNNQQVELSMGMSGDYVAAIEEGATIIRVGTAIFGARPPQGVTQ
ncbi:MAG: YggS family pyridoxal phosphate-dependent enzyme [Desulfobulbaceae bacterium]|nr:YggS family pyridoxal phosphate-dependent enzyme [Desulfobulbaceae bacterium]